MDTETKSYFEKLDQRMAAMEALITQLREEVWQVRDGLVAIVASKVDLDEVNNNLSRKINRLDARTDQDIRVIIKDIALLKQAQFGPA